MPAHKGVASVDDRELHDTSIIISSYLLVGGERHLVAIHLFRSIDALLYGR
ncbi:hypothetical protein [Ferrimicrobium acidiphilum]|uniref:hypothetical protein n=1 Tax=Ferrimicrobium acidiphilum TaxID=121039 RepID=UPI00146FD8B4|nr:hypothetical protein [Ferrimicrobium acidiphilum]